MYCRHETEGGITCSAAWKQEVSAMLQVATATNRRQDTRHPRHPTDDERPADDSSLRGKIHEEPAISIGLHLRSRWKLSYDRGHFHLAL